MTSLKNVDRIAEIKKDVKDFHPNDLAEYIMNLEDHNDQLRGALQHVLPITESYIHDQYDGTRYLHPALAEIETARIALEEPDGI